MNTSKRVIALGFFDGVHRGHGALLRRVKEIAQQKNAIPAAFTFDQHPSRVITGESVPLITSVDTRIWLMGHYYGIEDVVVSNFEGMMRMDWQEFITQYLIGELKAVHIVAGHDFHFGYMGKGTPQRLAEKCRELGVGCEIIPRVEQDGITVSSTYIRNLLAQGELDRAAEFLGYPYTIVSHVVHGKRIGQSALGIPTVNLQPPAGVMMPAFGVYTARAWFDGQCRNAVANIGIRPSIADNDGSVSIEAHLLDFQGDLYGHPVRLELFHRLRGEQSFASLSTLSQAIQQNVQQARDFFLAHSECSSGIL